MREAHRIFVAVVIAILICQCSSGRYVKPDLDIGDRRVGLVMVNYWAASERHLGEAVSRFTGILAKALRREIRDNTPYQLIHIQYGPVQGAASNHLGTLFASDLIGQSDFREALQTIAARDRLDYLLIVYLHNWKFHRMKTLYPNVEMLIHILDTGRDEIVFQDQCEFRCDPHLLSQVVSTLPGYYSTNTGCDPAERFQWLEPDSLDLPNPSDFPEASALFIIDEASVNVQIKPGNLFTSFTKHGNVYTTETRHVAVKILNERGYHYADVEIPFSEGIHLEDLEARTITSEGKIIPLTADQIHEVSLFPEYIFFSDIKAKKFTLSGIEPDCIIEYRYRHITEFPSLWGQWNFQKPEPVLCSRFALDVPRGLEYLIYFTCPDHLPGEFRNLTDDLEQWEVKGGYREGSFSREPRLTREYVLRDLPALRYEEYMPPVAEVVPRLSYCSATFGDIPLMTSWADISQWYRRMIGESLTADQEIRRQVALITAGQEDEELKARAIFRYVQGNIRYVAKELGMGKIVPQQAGQVYQKKYGDCKGFSALLISMLAEAGITACPAILRTRNEGRLDNRYVSLNQFNHMIVLARVNGQDVWLDPSAENCSYGTVPWYVQGAEALVLNEDSELMTIPRAGETETSSLRIVRCRVDHEGTVTMSGQISIEGQKKMELAGQLRALNLDLREKYLQEYLSGSIPDLGKPDCTCDRLDSLDGPLEITFQGQISHAATVTDNAIIIRPGKLLSVRKYELSDDRTYPLVFPYPYRCQDKVTIEMPDGCRMVEFSPASVLSPAGDCHITCKQNDHEIEYTRVFSLKNIHIPTDQVRRFNQFCERVNQANQEEVVLSRAP
jgi:transglutaminase-like putative cysteine protease